MVAAAARSSRCTQNSLLAQLQASLASSSLPPPLPSRTQQAQEGLDAVAALPLDSPQRKEAEGVACLRFCGAIDALSGAGLSVGAQLHHSLPQRTWRQLLLAARGCAGCELDGSGVLVAAEAAPALVDDGQSGVSEGCHCSAGQLV